MASLIPNLARDNISLYTFPLAWAISIFSLYYSRRLYTTATNRSPNLIIPRNFLADVAPSPALSTQLKARIQRADAAAQNGFENLGIYLAALAVGNAAGLRAGMLNAASLAWVGLRVVYTVAYVRSDVLPGWLRSGAYLGSMEVLFFLVVRAAGQFNATVV